MSCDRRFTYWLSVAICVCVPFSAHADNISIPPSRDNTLFSTNGTTSNGAGDGVFSGRTGVQGNSTRQRGMLAFDVAGNVPAGATVTSASLTLWLLMSPGGQAQTHTLHRVLADWGEGTSSSFGGTGAPSTPGDATWLHTLWQDQFWASEGGDFDATVSSSQIVGSEAVFYTWPSTPEMVADVQSWLDAPGSNYGWLLHGNEDSIFTARKFASRENVSVLLRPELAIEYSMPGDCPEDLDNSGSVDAADLAMLLGSWGACPGCPADFDGSGIIDAADLAQLLGSWGPC